VAKFKGGTRRIFIAEYSDTVVNIVGRQLFRGQMYSLLYRVLSLSDIKPSHAFPRHV
jgi:hypothetical protein